ncbi:hypothetical protein [Nocardioides sp.]|uniref:hypothetical protein n=1 Tax=Nocardioides sp. TaxID=35761 RepID=UPI0039E2D62F
MWDVAITLTRHGKPLVGKKILEQMRVGGTWTTPSYSRTDASGTVHYYPVMIGEQPYKERFVFKGDKHSAPVSKVVKIPTYPG